MKSTTSPAANQPAEPLSSEAARRHLVDSIVQFVERTRLRPSYREHVLLEKFVQGQLSIDQVVEQLELKQPGQ